MNFIAPIVEGHGELDAVPIILRRIGHEFYGINFEVNAPYRVNASSFLKFDTDFRKAIQIAAGKAVENKGIVLLILDCEDHCPAKVGPEILARAREERSDAIYLVCLAFREFETWFLYGAKSLAGVSGLPNDLAPPNEPEAFRDAKGWLGKQMPSGYKETSHQASFASKVSLEEAMQSASFRRLKERLFTVNFDSENNP